MPVWTASLSLSSECLFFSSSSSSSSSSFSFSEPFQCTELFFYGCLSLSFPLSFLWRLIAVQLAHMKWKLGNMSLSCVSYALRGPQLSALYVNVWFKIYINMTNETKIFSSFCNVNYGVRIIPWHTCYPLNWLNWWNFLLEKIGVQCEWTTRIHFKCAHICTVVQPDRICVYIIIWLFDYVFLILNLCFAKSIFYLRIFQGQKFSVVSIFYFWSVLKEDKWRIF